MKVVLADYGAGNLRSVLCRVRACGRQSTQISTDPATVREAPLVVIAGVGHLESAARGIEPLVGRAARARRGGPAVARHLRRPAAPLRGERGGRPRARAAEPGGIRRLQRAPSAAHGLERAVPSTAPSELLDGLDGDDVYFAHSYAAGRPALSAWRRWSTTGLSSPRSSPAPSPASSSIPSGAAPTGARVLENALRMVKKRVIPCLDVAGGRVVKGVRFESLRDVGDPVELATRYSELGADELVFLDITATIEGRRPTLELVERAAEQLTIPFTVGGGISRLEDARDAAARRRRQGRRQPRRGRRSRDPRLAGGRVRRPGRRLRDRRPCQARSSPHGGRTPRGLDAVAWAPARPIVGPARSC